MIKLRRWRRGLEIRFRYLCLLSAAIFHELSAFPDFPPTKVHSRLCRRRRKG
jgi:hypothetical protein